MGAQCTGRTVLTGRIVLTGRTCTDGTWLSPVGCWSTIVGIAWLGAVRHVVWGYRAGLRGAGNTIVRGFILGPRGCGIRIWRLASIRRRGRAISGGGGRASGRVAAWLEAGEGGVRQDIVEADPALSPSRTRTGAPVRSDTARAGWTETASPVRNESSADEPSVFNEIPSPVSTDPTKLSLWQVVGVREAGESPSLRKVLESVVQVALENTRASKLSSRDGGTLSVGVERVGLEALNRRVGLGLWSRAGLGFWPGPRVGDTGDRGCGSGRPEGLGSNDCWNSGEF